MQASGWRENEYYSYLIRMWRVLPVAEGLETESAPWRASLHNPHTGEVHHFVDLGSLFGFLRDKAGERSPPAADS